MGGSALVSREYVADTAEQYSTVAHSANLVVDFAAGDLHSFQLSANASLTS